MIWASDASGAEAAVAGAAEEAAGVGRPTSAIENPGPTGPLSASTVAPIGWGAAAAGLDDGAGRLSRVGVGAGERPLRVFRPHGGEDRPQGHCTRDRKSPRLNSR